MDDRYCTIKFKERFYKNKKKKSFFLLFLLFLFFLLFLLVFCFFVFFVFCFFFVYFYPSTPPPTLMGVDLRKNLRQRHRVCHDNSTSPS